MKKIILKKFKKTYKISEDLTYDSNTSNNNNNFLKYIYIYIYIYINIDIFTNIYLLKFKLNN